MLELAPGKRPVDIPLAGNHTNLTDNLNLHILDLERIQLNTSRLIGLDGQLPILLIPARIEPHIIFSQDRFHHRNIIGEQGYAEPFCGFDELFLH